MPGARDSDNGHKALCPLSVGHLRRPFLQKQKVIVDMAAGGGKDNGNEQSYLGNRSFNVYLRGS